MKQHIALFLVSCLFAIIGFPSLGITKDKHFVIDYRKEGLMPSIQTAENKTVESITIGDKFPITIQAPPGHHLKFSRKGDTINITSAVVTPKQQQKVMQIHPLLDFVSQVLEKLRSYARKLTVERRDSIKAKRPAFMGTLMGKKEQKKH